MCFGKMNRPAFTSRAILPPNFASHSWNPTPLLWTVRSELCSSRV